MDEEIEEERGLRLTVIEPDELDSKESLETLLNFSSPSEEVRIKVPEPCRPRSVKISDSSSRSKDKEIVIKRAQFCHFPNHKLLEPNRRNSARNKFTTT